MQEAYAVYRNPLFMHTDGCTARRAQQCVCVGGMEVGQSFKASKGE